MDTGTKEHTVSVAISIFNDNPFHSRGKNRHICLDKFDNNLLKLKIHTTVRFICKLVKCGKVCLSASKGNQLWSRS